jgi:hypothetical protein
MSPMDHDDALRLARELRLQSFGAGRSDRIAEPVVEPLWSGLRVIAAAQGDAGVLLHEGEELLGHEELTQALTQAVAPTASGVILDAYVTKQISGEDTGIRSGIMPMPSVGRLLARSLVGGRILDKAQQLEDDRADRAAERFEEEDPVNLVAVDLLWLDGQWLLDVPLLERKRLLAAVLPGDPIVRASMYVRPPIETWIGSWRAQGFRSLAFKGANSRYRPGEVAPDWITTPIPRR